MLELNKLELNKLELNKLELNKLELNKLELNKLELNKLELNKLELNKLELEEVAIYKKIYYYDKYNTHLIYRFKILETIGKGSFSNVVKVYDYKNKIYSAVKIINCNSTNYSNNTSNNSSNNNIDIYNEINILKNLKKKEDNHITKLFEYFIFRNELCIVFKLYSITLHSYIHDLNIVNRKKNYIYLKQIVEGIKYLQLNNIIHCDIKPNNIVFQDATFNRIILIDFGISVYTKDIIDLCNQKTQTIGYRSPEVILNCITNNKVQYNYKIDIWSIGCIAYELFYRKRLFNSSKSIELFIQQNILLDNPDYDYLKNYKEIHKLYDDIENPSYIKYDSQIYLFKKNKFIEKHTDKNYIINFILKCLEWNIYKRINYNQAIKHLESLINLQKFNTIIV